MPISRALTVSCFRSRLKLSTSSAQQLPSPTAADPNSMVTEEEADLSAAASPIPWPLSSRQLPAPCSVAALENLGNTCFLNVILQVLRYTPGFIQELSALRAAVTASIQLQESAWGCAREESDESTPATWRFVLLLCKLYEDMTTKEELWLVTREGHVPPTGPESLLDVLREINPMFEGREQHDAHELLRCVQCYLTEAATTVNALRLAGASHRRSASFVPVQPPPAVDREGGGYSPHAAGIECLSVDNGPTQGSTASTAAADCNSSGDCVLQPLRGGGRPFTDMRLSTLPVRHADRAWRGDAAIGSHVASTCAMEAEAVRHCRFTKPEKLATPLLSCAARSLCDTLERCLPIAVQAEEKAIDPTANKRCQTVSEGKGNGAPPAHSSTDGDQSECQADSYMSPKRAKIVLAGASVSDASVAQPGPYKIMSADNCPAAQQRGALRQTTILNLFTKLATSPARSSERRESAHLSADISPVHCSTEAGAACSSAGMNPFDIPGDQGPADLPGDADLTVPTGNTSTVPLFGGRSLTEPAAGMSSACCDTYDKSSAEYPCNSWTSACLSEVPELMTSCGRIAAASMPKTTLLTVPAGDTTTSFHQEVDCKLQDPSDSSPMPSVCSGVVIESGAIDVTDRLFQGKLVVRTRCFDCESSKDRGDVFADVNVPVRRTAQDSSARGLLSARTNDSSKNCSSDVSDADEPNSADTVSISRAFCEREFLQGDNKYFCEHCLHHAEADISTYYTNLPPILTIHLKRFAATYADGYSMLRKINDHVPTPLVLPCMVCRESQPCTNEGHRYFLYAVVVHVGTSVDLGHYVCYVRVAKGPAMTDGNGGSDCDEPVIGQQHVGAEQPCWVTLDDDRATVNGCNADVDALLGATASRATPYLLFYCRASNSASANHSPSHGVADSLVAVPPELLLPVSSRRLCYDSD